MSARRSARSPSPDFIQFAPGLPKTRRARSCAASCARSPKASTGSLGDTSTLADPSVVDDLIENRKANVGAPELRGHGHGWRLVVLAAAIADPPGSFSAARHPIPGSPGSGRGMSVNAERLRRHQSALRPPHRAGTGDPAQGARHRLLPPGRNNHPAEPARQLALRRHQGHRRGTRRRRNHRPSRTERQFRQPRPRAGPKPPRLRRPRRDAVLPAAQEGRPRPDPGQSALRRLLLPRAVAQARRHGPRRGRQQRRHPDAHPHLRPDFVPRRLHRRRAIRSRPPATA